ncbi:MAG: hypothetical protein GX444_16740 [Myxococcales bacterium]|nr:hypothetical protein [Myxococcales bacterium]
MLYLSVAWPVLLLVLWHYRSRGKPLGANLVRLLWLCLVATVIFAYWRYLWPIKGYEDAFPIDDSYITLSAARNFAAHNLFAVNPDAPLAGITSPFHVLLVGLLGKAVGVVWADRLLGFLAFFFTVAGTVVWTRQLNDDPLPAAAAGALCALSGPLIFGALNGLETDLFAALIIWSAVLYEKGRQAGKWFVGAGLLVGLAIVTRPEGYFLAVAIFSVAFFERIKGRYPLSWATYFGALLAVALIVSPYLLANYHLLGRVFPLTVSAKQHFFASSCTPIFQPIVMTFFSPLMLLGPFVILIPFLFVASEWRRRLYPAAFILIFYLAYLVKFPGALGHYWGRYQHPLLPFVLAGLTVGAVHFVAKKNARHPRTGTVIGVILAIFLFVGTGLNTSIQRGVYRHAIENAKDGGYLWEVMEWLRANTAPGDSVATHDIGVVTYFSGRKVIDLVGLSDPEIAAIYAHHQAPCGGFNPRADSLYQLLAKRRPKIVYFAPSWDELYLGLLRIDGGRHLALAHRSEAKFDLGAIKDLKFHEYDFYLGDWVNDLRQTGTGQSAATTAAN